MNADPPTRPLIEIGWVLDRHLEPVDASATRAAIESTAEWMRARFSGFDWRLPSVEREIVQAPREQPVTLLELASAELSLHHWDFAIAVTSSDLEAYSIPSAWAVSSRALGAGVISTFRIDPLARRQDAPDAEREQLIRRRLHRLALCVIGHLAGLSLTETGAGPMARRTREQDLDAEELELDPTQTRLLEGGWSRVADARLEEESGSRGRVRFLFGAIWRARHEILDNIRSSRCWEFPFRLTRLSTAAVSALAIVSLTAEAWELGTNLPLIDAALLAVGVVVVTSIHVLRRQRLLAPMRFSRTEQSVVTSVSIVSFVLLGMATIYVVLVAVAWSVLALLFDPELIARWTGRTLAGIDGQTYFAQSLFVSSAAVLVGALGASFEGQSYVKHVAWVDEEI